MFGPEATEERIKEELLGYSDYRLHLFCVQSGSKRLLKHQLHPREVRAHAWSTSEMEHRGSTSP